MVLKDLFGVVHFGLAFYIKPAVGSGVVAYAGHVGPVAVVGAGVVVNESVFEPGGAPSPIYIEVFYEVAGHILSAPIAHESGMQQFAHASIYKGLSGLAGAPLFKSSFVGLHGWGLIFYTVFLKECRTVFPHGKSEIVAPHQFKENPIGGIVGPMLGLKIFEVLHNASWGKIAHG